MWSADSINGPGGGPTDGDRDRDADSVHDVTRTQDATPPGRQRVSQGLQSVNSRGDRGSSHSTRVLDDVATVESVANVDSVGSNPI